MSNIKIKVGQQNTLKVSPTNQSVNLINSISDPNIKVKIEQQNTLVRLGQQNALKVLSSYPLGNLINSISDISNVEIINPVEDGSLLVFKTSTQKWQSTIELDGGTY